jgi:putative flippase GtrA
MKKKIGAILKESFLSVQFLKFLLVGGTAALANFFSGLLIRELFPTLLNEVSVVTGYTIGTIISFVFNKIYTFKANDESTTIQAMKFIVVSVTSALLGAGISRLVLVIYEVLGIRTIDLETAKNVSHIIAIGITTIYNFLAMKFFSFKKITLPKR